MATKAPSMRLKCDAAPKLHFKSMSAIEEVSRLFELRIEAVSEDRSIAADDVLGKPAAVALEVAEGEFRWWHGVVTAFGIDGSVGRYFRYRMVVRPWLWLLTRSTDMRIFQEKSVPDIVKQVFNEYSSSFNLELSRTHAARTYCVQYRETDFAFVSRLMEEEGIFYYFRHSEDKHELVLADATTTFVPSAGFDIVPYREEEEELTELQVISRWQMRHEIQSGKSTLADYNFETPSTSLQSDTVASDHESGYELYDYPGGYSTAAAGKPRAQLRLDEAAGRFTRYTGAGNTPGLAAGAKFTLEQHPRDDQNDDYVVLQTQIDMTLAAYESGIGEDTGLLCRFVAQRHDEPFAPARTTRKPTVGGPQTAVVVGQAGSEIHTDKYGRVKVQFHWDREGKKDDKSSCWLRVASAWAGNGWGMLSIPRIGQEVVVAFLEGDPDQPIVVGSVYNAEHMPPYELPAHHSAMSLKSRSFGGGANDYNELRFDDTKGKEYLILQAQKDRYDVVKNDLKTDITGKEERKVGKDQLIDIAANAELTVGKAMKQAITDELHLDVGKDHLVKVGASQGVDVVQDISAEAGQNWSLKAGQDIHAKAGMNIGAEAGMNVHLKGGMNVVIEAGMQLTIKAGPASVVLGPDGVSITGPMVKVNSGGAAGSGAGAKPKKPTAAKKAKAHAKLKDPLEGKHR